MVTGDGVLVVRHENELSGTTDVASRVEFAGRRTTKVVDGVKRTGWFTEDFTWAELSVLRARERLPSLRIANTAFDGVEPILRLVDLMELLDAECLRVGRRVGMVAELKHAQYFASLGLSLDELFADAVAGWVGVPSLVVESFELGVLARVRDRGVGGSLVFLADAVGAPPDAVVEHGRGVRSYRDHLTSEGLTELVDLVDGVSVSRKLVLAKGGRDGGSRGASLHTTDLIGRIHDVGLTAYCWTLRPENAFLAKASRRSGTGLGAGGAGGAGGRVGGRVGWFVRFVRLLVGWVRWLRGLGWYCERG